VSSSRWCILNSPLLLRVGTAPVSGSGLSVGSQGEAVAGRAGKTESDSRYSRMLRRFTKSSAEAQVLSTAAQKRFL